MTLKSFWLYDLYLSILTVLETQTKILFMFVYLFIKSNKPLYTNMFYEK